MYLNVWPLSLQGQHSNTYPTPSVVHLGADLVSSFPGFGGDGLPGSGTGLDSSSPVSMALLLQGRQSSLSHAQSFAQGLLLPSRVIMVSPPHLSTNLTAGLPQASPMASSLAWRAFLNAESLVKGTNMGVSVTLTLVSSFPVSLGPSCPSPSAFFPSDFPSFLSGYFLPSLPSLPSGWSLISAILAPPLLERNQYLFLKSFSFLFSLISSPDLFILLSPAISWRRSL